MVHKIDRLLNKASLEILKAMIGRRIESISHDGEEFESVSGVVQFSMDGRSVCLRSFTDPVDYYGSDEDVVTLEMEDGAYKYTFPTLHEFSIGRTISGISVVNYCIHSNGEEDDSEYEYRVTAAIIMTLDDGSQISFERLDDFIELIVIRNGNNLQEKLRPAESYFGKHDSSWNVTCSVDVIELK